MQKKGYEFSFSWLFAIFVGATIIFLAIYATTQIIDTEQTRIDTVGAKQIGVLLTPVETNLEQSRLATISLAEEMNLISNCSSSDNEFGKQFLSANVRSRVGREWQPQPGVQSTFKNKYIFSRNPAHGEEELYVFTKPFQFPFKVADITIVYGDKTSYCFVLPSSAGKEGEIKDELESLELKNIQIVNDVSSCLPEDITVCTSSSCDVNIQLNSKRVISSDGEKRYVESTERNDKFALLFAAIFSDKEIYDCQVNRLGLRADKLADLYRLKSSYLTQKGCSSAPLLPSALQIYQSSVSRDILSSENQAEDLRLTNANLNCRLF